MERQLFTYDRWDQRNMCVFAFYNVTLIAELPGLLVGAKFATAEIDYEKGALRLWDDNKMEAHEFTLMLSVRKKGHH